LLLVANVSRRVKLFTPGKAQALDSVVSASSHSVENQIHSMSAHYGPEQDKHWPNWVHEIAFVPGGNFHVLRIIKTSK
jgi:hypothetical protein